MPKKKEETINPLFIKELKNKRRSLGLIKFEHKLHFNISKWINSTENIIIACFGEKSNQLKQFQDIVEKIPDDEDDDFQTYDIKTCKRMIKDLLTNFIKELELKIKTNQSPSGLLLTISPKIKVETNQIVIQKVKIEQTIETILNHIKETEPDEKRIKEAETQLNELKEEMKKENPQWSVIKKVLMWLLNFSRDAFLQIIPILLQHYSGK